MTQEAPGGTGSLLMRSLIAWHGDLTGALICLAGMVVIMYAPRGS